jgi:hypothetical protein
MGTDLGYLYAAKDVATRLIAAGFCMDPGPPV